VNINNVFESENKSSRNFSEELQLDQEL